MPSTRGRDPAVEEEFLGALYKGGELLASGKIVEAREHLEKAHGLAPKNEKAQNLLGLTYFKLGLFDRASEVYERLVNENPVDATLRVNLGLVYLKTNNLERCIKEFETATDLEPTHKKAHNYLGLALAQQGTYEKAKEHFELAGSDQMAEKMARAIANQSSPSGLNPVPRQVPKTVVLGDEDPSASAVYRALKVPIPEKPPPPPEEDEAIEVMSDEEVPSEAFVVPDEVKVAAPPPPPPPSESDNDALNSDWGASLPSTPRRDAVERKAETVDDEMILAADEGPTDSAPIEAAVEEMPMLDAVVEVMPVEAADATQAGDVTEIADAAVEVVPDDQLEPAVEAPPAPPLEASIVEVAAEPPPAPVPSAPPPAWLTSESQEAPKPEAPPDESWVTAEAPVEAPPPEEAPAAKRSRWAAADAEVSSWGMSAAEPVVEPAAPIDVPEVPPLEVAAEPPQEIAPLEMPALGPVTSPSQITAAAEAVAAEPIDTSPAPAEDLPPDMAADDASWATGGAVAAVPEAPPDALPTTPDDDSWATGTPEPAQTEWATEQMAGVEASSSWAQSQPVRASAPEPALDPVPDAEPIAEQIISAEVAMPDDAMAAPSPSAPLPITVEEPAPAPVALPPAGYSAMQPQRLVDLGANGAWVQEPNAGPFHLSIDGLAVTIAGEMLMRMGGLIAVVGSINVNPEHRRRRGRPTSEPFGVGPNQLQRVTGNGVVYLEPGRSKFHAVDLTDQNGVNIDDDGAYVREELVFAFEEPISYENGKLSNDAQALELAHLKGTGRILLQLDGTLRAMPIPVGAPLVVPVARMVGWFGRVTPRLMGFGGRGAVELTGEGYALLGTPSERA
ncbi:MAG: tetratricopeptide repeat protein [Archangium sp.]